MHQDDSIQAVVEIMERSDADYRLKVYRFVFLVSNGMQIETARRKAFK
jgi:hypothetical protein